MSSIHSILNNIKENLNRRELIELLIKQIPEKANASDVRLVIIPISENGKKCSLLRIKSWIEEEKANHNIKNDEVVLGFDVDGTLTNLGLKGIKIGDQQLRGETETREFFNYMNNSNPPIKWFGLSARSIDKGTLAGVASTLYGEKALNFIPNKWLNTNCFTGEKDKWGNYKPIIKNIIANEDESVSFEYDGIKYKSYQCDNAITCYSFTKEEGPNAYNKHASLEFAIKKYFPEYPKLIIFVDDNAKNVMTVYKHYKNRKDLKAKVICVLYEPEQEEESHGPAMIELQEEMGKLKFQ